MTPEEALAKLNENHRTAMRTLWHPSDATTIDSSDAVELQNMGLVQKQDNGLFGFTPLGEQVCQLLPEEEPAPKPKSPFH